MKELTGGRPYPGPEQIVGASGLANLGELPSRNLLGDRLGALEELLAGVDGRPLAAALYGAEPLPKDARGKRASRLIRGVREAGGGADEEAS